MISFMVLKQLIVEVVGHVDHGKTSILDSIRGTAVAASEAGLITQCISCTNIPFETIKKLCGKGVEKIKIPFKIGGKEITIPVGVELGDNWGDMEEWTA